jgi:hypothetical protein
VLGPSVRASVNAGKPFLPQLVPAPRNQSASDWEHEAYRRICVVMEPRAKRKYLAGSAT